MTRRYALRHRQKILEALRFSGWLLLMSVVVLVGTVGPTLLLWWSTAVPAAIGTAIFALVLFSVVTMLPLEFFAYIGLYFDRRPEDLPLTGFKFGRTLYRESGRLDAIARDAGLPPLSDFESPDVLDTGRPPTWYRPGSALPTVAYLLSRLDPDLRVHRDLRHVQRALRAAHEQGASFYFIVHTLGGMTNAEVEARRREHPPATGD